MKNFAMFAKILILTKCNINFKARMDVECKTFKNAHKICDDDDDT